MLRQIRVIVTVTKPTALTVVVVVRRRSVIHGGYASLMADDAIPEPLEVLPEDWETALAVVAHPDDMEYGAAAAVARWTSQGKKVVYTLVTSGEAGIDGMDPAKAAPLREAEERAGAAIVGVDTVEFLGGRDGMLEYGLPLRRDIAAAIRRHRPDMVVTVNFRETFGPGMLNQADHIATGRAVIDGVRDAANRWVFRELLDDGLQPWGGVRAVLASGSPLATHGVDVTDTLALGIESLRAHEAYLAGLGNQMDPEEFLESIARMTGSRLGCRYGVSFEVFPFQLF
jgi:LmbE family N-acetylglucosaminyl deacetylase